MTYLRDEVDALRKGAGQEFENALALADPTLETIRAHGGDPRFVLCVLTSARWRRLRPLRPEFGRWTRLLGQLLREPALHALLVTEREPRGRLKQAAEDALGFLQSFHWQDEGILDSRGTGLVRAHKRRASLHLDRVVGVLAWHLREGTTGPFDRLVTLAELVAAFWAVRRKGSSGIDPIAFELVKKRLQRSDKDYNRRFVVTVERVKFHNLHRFLAITLDDQRLTPCGTACPPGPDDPDDPLSQGKILMESPQPTPGSHDDEESRGQRTQEGTGDPPRFEFHHPRQEATGDGPSAKLNRRSALRFNPAGASRATRARVVSPPETSAGKELGNWEAGAARTRGQIGSSQHDGPPDQCHFRPQRT